jgi:hypothetical protein
MLLVCQLPLLEMLLMFGQHGAPDHNRKVFVTKIPTIQCVGFNKEVLNNGRMA